MSQTMRVKLQAYYDALYGYFGPQQWWPGDTAFEVMMGAVLTQNTNWTNVELAIDHLKKAGLLSPEAMKRVRVSQLARLIKPSGYFNIKAGRLKNVVSFLFEQYSGSIPSMIRMNGSLLRQQLLAINGVGPETADSILLYALNKPVFVVDAYTKRWLYRHGLISRHAGYHEVQQMFMSSLDHDVPFFNEYHALIVRLGKTFCRPHPRCEGCPLKRISYSLKNRCSVCYRFSGKRHHLSKGKNEISCCSA